MDFKRLKSFYDKNGYSILPVKPGMLLEIHEKVWEWENKRIWKFKGLVLKVKKPNHPDGTFTIRWDVARMTIEKIYPLSFGNFDKVLLIDDYKIRRSKLYYLREKVGKWARMKSKIAAWDRNSNLIEEKVVKKEEEKTSE